MNVKEAVLLVIALVLLIGLIVVTMYACHMPPFRENFAEQEDFMGFEGFEGDSGELNEREKELFEGIANGTVTDDDIKKFVEDGTINTSLAEKFVKHMEKMENMQDKVEDTSEEDIPTPPNPPPKPKAIPASKPVAAKKDIKEKMKSKNSEEDTPDNLEGFISKENFYANANFQ